MCICTLENLNIDIDKLKKKITSKTKSIMLVHALGNCTSMNELKKLAVLAIKTILNFLVIYEFIFLKLTKFII